MILHGSEYVTDIIKPRQGVIAIAFFVCILVYVYLSVNNIAPNYLTHQLSFPWGAFRWIQG